VLTLCGCRDKGPQTAGLHLDQIRLPQGFHINLYATGVMGARSMTLGDSGTVFVGTRWQGCVYALMNRTGSDRAEEVVVLAQGLNQPNGVAFHHGALYVAEPRLILRYDDIERRLKNPPEPVVISDAFPLGQRGHAVKYIGFGPDGLLYVAVGKPCDVCETEDERFGTIMRMNRDGSRLEIFARGIRNSVGFDWHPDTKELWFTDNGPDRLGENIPPDELNRAPVQGMNFGFPYCDGKSIPDPFFGKKHNCREFTPAEMELGPHVAALGMKFYTGRMFPNEYRHSIFIAEHGSSSRTIPIGYRITVVTLKGNTPVKYEPFAEGWLQKASSWGRPVDVLVMPDGALLVSDDKAGAIYRIRYNR